MDDEIRFQDSKFRRPKFVHPGRRYRQISFDIDANYSDVSESCEDEVFVDEPRNSDKTSSKPLLQPKNRARSPSFKIKRKYYRLRRCLKLLCCVLTAVSSCLLILAIVIFAMQKSGINVLGGNLYYGSAGQETTSAHTPEVLGCSDIQVEDVWITGFPKLITESAFRLVDINGDGTLDVLFGFGTGADGHNVPGLVCDIYFNGTRPCFGGVLSIDGATGRELWRHYTEHEVFALNCNRDINGDGVNECLAGGRGGVFRAINGQDGELLWRFANDEAFNDEMNVYTPQYIRDVNGDGVPDVLLAHGGDPMRESGEPVTLSGELVILSGKYGGVLRWVKVPDHMETYFSPQLYRQSTDTLAVLFGTGGETHGGALWWIDLEDLLRGHMSKGVDYSDISLIKAKKLYSDPFKGIMTPPALADINKDGVEDIVIPAFNSTVVAIDGETLQQLWKTTFTGAESYNTPAVGYYNDDDVPDFMVRYAHGPGFPVYYDSVTTILDGKTGKMVLDKPVRDSIGVQSSPLAVSVEGFGNDLFLYWVADCEDHEGQGGEFTFAEDTNVHQQSRSDVCRLRFNTRGFTKLMVSSSHTPHPGITVYDSRQRQRVEHSAWVNTTMEAIEFVKKHQQYLEDYLDHQSHRGAHQRPKNAGRKTVHHNLASRPAHSHTKVYKSNSLHSAPSYPKQNGRQNQNGRSYGRHYSNVNNNRQYTEKSNDRNGFGSFSTGPSKNRDYEQYDLDKKNYGDFENLFRDHTNRNGAQYDSDKQRNKWYQNYLPVDGSQNTDQFPIKERNTYSGSKYHYPKAEYTVPSQSGRFLGRKDLSQRIGRQTATRREKRHMSPHDDNGIQRLLSTGTLAPPLLSPSHPAYNNSIDLVFATYWIFPAKTEALLPEDQACVRQLMRNTSMRNDRYGKYYGLDDHAFHHAVTDECLARGGRQPAEGGTFQDAKEYNPYDLKMGQLTVYRLRLKCTCPDAGLTGGKKCGSILPFHKQGWAAYMGTRGTSHFKTRNAW